MSLLMDALKKAEQAKQGGAGADVPSRADASVETLARTEPEKEIAPVAHEGEATRLELTLEEPEADHHQEGHAADKPAQQAAPEEEPVAQRSLPDDSAEAVAETVEESAAVEPQKMTPAPVEAVTTAGAESSESDSAGKPSHLSTEQKIDAVSAERRERPMAEEKPALVPHTVPAPDPQQLQRTFVLKSRAAARRKRLLLFSLGGVALLSLLGGGYYYFDNAISSLDSTSLVAAGGYVDETAGQDVMEPVEVMDDGAGSVYEQVQVTQDSGGGEPMQASAPLQQTASDLQATSMQSSAEPPVTRWSASDDVATAPVHETVMAGEPEPVSVRPAPQTRIHIVRTQTTDPFNRRLLEAYQAYQAGRYSQAAGLYQEVLKQDATSRDALLGLAAIAHRGGDRERAADYYITLLKYDPRDSSAISGLVSLQGASLTVENETRIKMLLDQEPEAAHLHFTLGTLYAGQSRWADAQQSFFNAHRYAPDNADYAYNLAVSLDRIGKQAAALEYYRRAVALAGEQRVMFNLSEANGRIHALSGLADLSRQAR